MNREERAGKCKEGLTVAENMDTARTPVPHKHAHTPPVDTRASLLICYLFCPTIRKIPSRLPHGSWTSKRFSTLDAPRLTHFTQFSWVARSILAKIHKGVGCVDGCNPFRVNAKKHTHTTTHTCFSNMATIPASRQHHRRWMFFFLWNLKHVKLYTGHQHLPRHAHICLHTRGGGAWRSKI